MFCTVPSHVFLVLLFGMLLFFFGCIVCVLCLLSYAFGMSYVELCENGEMRCKKKNNSHDIADFCVQILKLTVVSALKLYRTCVCMLSHEQVGLS